MDLKKCSKGHFYNGEKYSSCPHCQESDVEDDVVKTPVKERTSFFSRRINDKKSPDVKELDTRTEDSPKSKVSQEEKETHTVSVFDPRQRRKAKQEANKETNKETKELAEDSPAEHSIPALNGVTASRGDNLTVSVFNPRERRQKKKEDTLRDEGLSTTSYSADEKEKINNGPVYGWLVGIAGPAYGQSFELYAKVTTMGSHPSNDIVFDDLESDNHVVIGYYANYSSFYLDMTHSNGDVLIDNKIVTTNTTLYYMTNFAVGDSIFMFVPLCKDGFSWDKNGTSIYNTQNNIQSFTSVGSNNYDKYSDIVYVNQNIDDDDEDAQTSVLISSPWRCMSCNALNSNVATKCRLCGDPK